MAQRKQRQSGPQEDKSRKEKRPEWYADGLGAEKQAEADQQRQRVGAWKLQQEWQAGVRVATVNCNSKGTLLRLLAGWSIKHVYDVILVQEHHESS